MVATTWETRELLILIAVATCEEANSDCTTESVAEQSGLDPIAASLGLRALDDAGYVTGIDVTTMAGLPFAMIEVRLRERGRRATAQWPNEDPTKILIHILDERISSAGDSAERTRLEVARDALLGVGRDILTSVLSAYARQAAGLP